MNKKLFILIFALLSMGLIADLYRTPQTLNQNHPKNLMESFKLKEFNNTVYTSIEGSPDEIKCSCCKLTYKKDDLHHRYINLLNYKEGDKLISIVSCNVAVLSILKTINTITSDDENVLFSRVIVDQSMLKKPDQD